jgi:hypothetical protein
MWVYKSKQGGPFILTSILVSHHADRSTCEMKSKTKKKLKMLFSFQSNRSPFTRVENQDFRFVLGFEVGADVHRRVAP